MNIHEYLPMLLAHPLFAGSEEADLLRALSESERSGEVFEREYHAGDPIPGDPAIGPAIGMICSGYASVATSQTDRHAILRRLSPGEIFGAAQLFSTESKASGPLSSITAAARCRVLFLCDHFLRTRLREDPGMSERYLSFLSDRIRFLNRRIASFTAGSALARLSNYLDSQIAEPEPDTIRLRTSLSDLADALDIGRASLYRAFDELEAQKVLVKAGKEIRILDRERLQTQI